MDWNDAFFGGGGDLDNHSPYRLSSVPALICGHSLVVFAWFGVERPFSVVSSQFPVGNPCSSVWIRVEKAVVGSLGIDDLLRALRVVSGSTGFLLRFGSPWRSLRLGARLLRSAWA